MILVDSSVWIDFFRGRETAQVNKLDSLLAEERIFVGDLILTEVLQGFRTDKDFNEARRTLDTFPTIELAGAEVALAAAKNFRMLQSLGFTVRKTIDTIIATRCILDGYRLLHADRDFEPFSKHLGLKVVHSDA